MDKNKKLFYTIIGLLVWLPQQRFSLKKHRCAEQKLIEN